MGDGLYTMGAPDEAWRVMVAAWELAPERGSDRTSGDSGWSLRRSSRQRRLCSKPGLTEWTLAGDRWMVERGALRDGNTAAKAATEAKVEARIWMAMETWEGISAKNLGVG